MKNAVSGDLGAQRNAAAEKFFKNKIHKPGSGPPSGSSSFPRGKALLETTDPVIGSLKGNSTVGGCVGGLKDARDYQGKKAGGR